MATPSSWNEFLERYELKRMFPEAKLNELADKVARDVSRQQKSLTGEAIFNSLYNDLSQGALGRELNSMIDPSVAFKVQQALEQQQQPRRTVSSPAAQNVPRAPQAGRANLQAPWADFDFSPNSIRDVNNYLDAQANNLAQRFNPDSANEFVRAAAVNVLVHKFRMSGPRPGSSPKQEQDLDFKPQIKFKPF